MFIEWFFNELDYSLSNVVSHVFQLPICVRRTQFLFDWISLSLPLLSLFTQPRPFCRLSVALGSTFIYGCEERKIKAFIVWTRRVGDTFQLPRIVESFLCVSFDKCWFSMMTVMRCDAIRASKVSASDLISNSETFTFGIWFVRPPSNDDEFNRQINMFEMGIFTWSQISRSKIHSDVAACSCMRVAVYLWFVTFACAVVWTVNARRDCRFKIINTRVDVASTHATNVSRTRVSQCKCVTTR